MAISEEFNFLPEIPRDARERMFEEMRSKSLKVPIEIPVRRVLTCFYEPESNSRGFVKIQVIELGGESSHESVTIRGKTSASGQVLTTSQVYRVQPADGKYRIKLVNPRSPSSPSSPTVYKIYDVTPGEWAVVAATYDKELVSDVVVDQQTTRDWTLVEIKDLATRSAPESLFMIGSAKRGKKIKILQAADLWNKGEQLKFSDHDLEPWEDVESFDAAWNIVRRVADRAAQEFTTAPFGAAFLELASGSVSQRSKFWKTDYRLQQSRSTVYVTEASSRNIKDVFIVHGRDEGAKDAVARFIGALGLKPIVLHEQLNGGRTIIEKFERHSEVQFAIILLTPDDAGSLALAPEAVSEPRARQNVIFEMGYFIGRIGRSRVFPLKKGSVQIPSDYDGVIYTAMDDAGGWQSSLKRELRQCGFEINPPGAD